MASILAVLRNLLRRLGLSGPEQAVSPPPPPPPAAHSEGRSIESKTEPTRPAPTVVAESGGSLGAEPSTEATLAMPQLVAVQGVFPVRGDGGTTAMVTLGMIQSYAGLSPVFGVPRAEGQLLSISIPPNQALFSLYGTSFGGNGMTNFALPNLVSRVAAGGSPVGEMDPQSLTLTWLIAVYPGAAPLIGSLALFGGSFVPDGWMAADGSLLSIRTYTALFETIGTAFGGNGATDFALPNLNGAAPVGSGQGPGLPPVSLGQKLGGTVAGLGLSYLISTQGLYPTSTGSGAFPANEQCLSQVVAYAGAQAPQGWAACDGSLVPIESNPALFNMIGTTYGGDGVTDFALPDLRGRMLAGIGG